MRRKRKAKVVWLPSDINNRLGTAPSAATSGSDSQTIIATLTAPPLGATPFTAEFPIVKDFQSGAAGGASAIVNPTTSLSDIENSGYRLRRIVGKLFFSCLQGAAQLAGDGSIFLVTAGFIIRRIDDQGAPAGSSLAAATGPFGPSAVTFDNISDPWIWRRSWIICDHSAAAAVLDPNVDAFAPSNSVNYSGGVLDGPHVDAKTARVVGPEERLFLDVTVEGINGSGQGAPGGVLLIGDLRVLGSLRTNVGNRRNASR